MGGIRVGKGRAGAQKKAKKAPANKAKGPAPEDKRAKAKDRDLIHRGVHVVVTKWGEELPAQTPAVETHDGLRLTPGCLIVTPRDGGDRYVMDPEQFEAEAG